MTALRIRILVQALNPHGSGRAYLAPPVPEPALSNGSLIVKGARVHNLKNIDFEIPHAAITVVTGVSGSGKSSLAFDTIYAEGQRRYIESLSAYARQFLERMEKPDVDEISGIAPAVAIRQKNTSRNPRSTVATATEIYDYLRLLYARIGRTYCLKCGGEVRKDTVDEIADRVLSPPPAGLGLTEGTRFSVLFEVLLPDRKSVANPPARRQAPPSHRHASSLAGSRRRVGTSPDAGTLAEVLDGLRHRGFNRLFQNGRVFEFSTPESLLDMDFAKPFFVLVDRLVVSPDLRPRLIDSIEICYKEGRGEAILEFVPDASHPDAPGRLVFNDRFECKQCRTAFQEPEPQLFSFNSPYGACPRCQGFGNTIDFDLELVIPDKSKSLAEGAIDPWNKPRYRSMFTEMKRLARQRGIPLDIPFSRLPSKDQRWVIEGDDTFPGIQGFFAFLERKKYKLHVRVFLSRYRGYATCPDCQGTRLRAEARAVRLAGKSVTEICQLTVRDARNFFDQLELTPAQAAIADKVLVEIRQRLRFLDEVGVEYLTLDRLASSLSGGEAQRIQLATSLGSNLVGALYVFDEPSIGLHPRDTGRLIEILRRLRDLGNTILVVEHDPDIIRAADYVLDLGPGAGELGGRVVAHGPLAEITAQPHSLTGRYLAGEMRIPVPSVRRRPNGNFLRIHGAFLHNLKHIDVNIPLNLMVTITGVSGSGKSTLVHDILYRTLQAQKLSGIAALGCGRLDGHQLIQEVVLVDQSPIGRSPRSNPVTYLKAFDVIREVFAATPDAKRRGYSAGHFSFNIPGGRCETCQGDGTVTVEMQFLADVELVCDECRGTRFKSGILEVRYKGKNIHEVLQLTVKEALAFFAAVPRIVQRLRILDEVGLGYLRLGQSATTLSGGEAQRLKLAAHLTHGSSEKVLYLFDEPTTGLHLDDIQKLLAAFRRLVEAGGSVLVIEHNLEVIKASDWVIDLGPEGGERGGYLVASGTPEQVVKNNRSHTAKYLARVLNNQHGISATNRK